MGQPIIKELRRKCKEMYCEGIGMREISEQTGIKYATLNQWHTRDRWHEARKAAKELASKKDIETAADKRARFATILKNIQAKGNAGIISGEIEIRTSDVIKAAETEARIEGILIDKVETTQKNTNEQMKEKLDKYAGLTKEEKRKLAKFVLEQP